MTPSFSISQACTLSHDFATDTTGLAEGGCTGIEVWFTKLEKHLEQHTAENTKIRLAEQGIKLVAAAYQGGMLLSQGDARQAAFDLFKKRLDLCQFFEIPTMILVADFARKVEQIDLERAMVSLIQASQWADSFGVQLALEFRGNDAFCSCLDTALLLVEQSNQPNLGICLDVFHYYKGPSKSEDLDRLTSKNLKHVQLCDVAGIPRELMTDSDRVFPGEGDFQLAPIVNRLAAMDYRGWVSLEMLNPMLMASKPSQIADLGLTALDRVFAPVSQPRS